MREMNVLCGSCAGTGKAVWWEIVNASDSIGTAEKRENVCEECNGTGYIKYAVFTTEEAEAILKHCGLSTED